MGGFSSAVQTRANTPHCSATIMLPAHFMCAWLRTCAGMRFSADEMCTKLLVSIGIMSSAAARNSASCGERKPTPPFSSATARLAAASSYKAHSVFSELFSSVSFSPQSKLGSLSSS